MKKLSRKSKTSFGDLQKKPKKPQKRVAKRFLGIAHPDHFDNATDLKLLQRLLKKYMF
tara:strand:- start:3069 stop:3242 length:174 start_codon:yes stop_codon:yes gene_type:complete